MKILPVQNQFFRKDIKQDTCLKTKPIALDCVNFSAKFNKKNIDRRYDIEKLKSFFEKSDEETFNKYLNMLTPFDMTQDALNLIDEKKVPLLKMNSDTIHTFIKTADDSGRHKLIYAKNENGESVFHLADSNQLKKIFLFLNSDEILKGIIEKNYDGYSPIHYCAIENNSLSEDIYSDSKNNESIAKLNLFLNCTEKENIMQLALLETDGGVSVFDLCGAKTVKELLHKLDTNNRAELIKRSGIDETTSYFHIANPDEKLVSVCKLLTPDDIKKLCMEPDEFNKNVFDYQTPKVREILSFYMKENAEKF